MGEGLDIEKAKFDLSTVRWIVGAFVGGVFLLVPPVFSLYSQVDEVKRDAALLSTANVKTETRLVSLEQARTEVAVERALAKASMENLLARVESVQRSLESITKDLRRDARPPR